MTLSREGLARELLRLAADLDKHAAHTERAVNEWGELISSGGGLGQRNAVSDPTGIAASSIRDHDPHDVAHQDRGPESPCPICVALLPARWRTGITTLRHLAAGRFGPVMLGANPATAARAVAIAAKGGQLGHGDRIRALTACRELEHVMDETTTIDRDKANAILRNEARHAAGARRCRACDQPEVELKGGFGIDCYNMRAQMIHRGRIDMADDDAFIAYVRGCVERGELDRPASPLYRTKIPKLHEGDQPQDAA